MRVWMLLAGLAMLFAIPCSVLADTYGDFDQCKFVGEISKADQNIAACDRVLADAKVTGPGRAAALSSRCGWWWAKKDPDRALADCDEAIRIDRGYAPAYVNRGNVHLNKGDVERAFGDFNEAIRLDPGNAWAYNARGDLYKNKGDFGHALADFSESIRLDPNYAMAYFFRGELYKTEGDFEHALADLNQSIRLDPNNAMADFTRGCVSYLMGENAAALADFTASIRLDPSDAAAYFNRGVAYYVVGGHGADAEADFRKATELLPKDSYAALWRDLAELRNNAPSHLPEAAKQLDMTVWPAPLITQFLGESNAAQTLAAAHDNDPKTNRGRTCEANFYSGEFALLKQNRQEALRLLRLAASDCPRGFIEAPAAMAELIVQR
ncbi:tetratricopeptide repeat protein [Bradyrhizobium sp.]|uniref:tetratricopeptide repeat protein n=1 Tax=Bradyrhizobium sp. TaxID=376 RepID=UPI003C507FF1